MFLADVFHGYHLAAALRLIAVERHVVGAGAIERDVHVAGGIKETLPFLLGFLFIEIERRAKLVGQIILQLRDVVWLSRDIVEFHVAGVIIDGCRFVTGGEPDGDHGYRNKNQFFHGDYF